MSFPMRPHALLHHVLWVWKQWGEGTRAPSAGDQRLHRVGPCTVDAEAAGPTYPQVTPPLAVVIQEQYGERHCQAIQP